MKTKVILPLLLLMGIYLSFDLLLPKIAAWGLELALGERVVINSARICQGRLIIDELNVGDLLQPRLSAREIQLTCSSFPFSLECSASHISFTVDKGAPFFKETVNQSSSPSFLDFLFKDSFFKNSLSFDSFDCSFYCAEIFAFFVDQTQGTQEMIEMKGYGRLSASMQPFYLSIASSATQAWGALHGDLLKKELSLKRVSAEQLVKLVPKVTWQAAGEVSGSLSLAEGGALAIDEGVLNVDEGIFYIKQGKLTLPPPLSLSSLPPFLLEVRHSSFIPALEKARFLAIDGQLNCLREAPAFNFKGIYQLDDGLNPLQQKQIHLSGSEKRDQKNDQKKGQEGTTYAAFLSLTNLEKTAEIEVFAKNWGEEQNLSLKLKGAEAADFYCLQVLLAPYFETLAELEVQRGQIDALFSLKMKGQSLVEFTLYDLAVKEFEASIPLLATSFGLKALSGNFQWQRKLKAAEMINAHLEVEAGYFHSLMLNHLQPKEEMRGLEEISGKIQFEKGQLLASTLHASLKGLKGTMHIKWPASRECLHLNFSGALADVAALFPLSLQSKVPPSLKKEQVALFADVIPYRQGLQIVAELAILPSPEQRNGGIDSLFNPKLKQEQRISLGWDLEWAKTSMPAKRRISSYQLLSSFQSMIPSLLAPSITMAKELKIKEQGLGGLGGLIIRNGWFYSKEMPLNQFAEPFLSSSGLKLQGTADILGEFDHRGLTVWYTLSQPCIDHEHFTIKSEVHRKEKEKEGAFFEPGSLGFAAPESNFKKGIHHFHFKSGAHFGKLYLKKPSFVEKSAALCLTAEEAELFLVDNQIYCPSLDLAMEGISFKGHLALDLSSENFSLQATSSSLTGTLSALKKAARPFVNFPLLDLPFDGKIALEKGLFFSLAKKEGQMATELRVEGALREGLFLGDDAGLNFKEISCQFAYDGASNSLKLADIESKWPFSQTQAVTLTSKQISFANLNEMACNFDFTGHFQQQPFIQLSGKAVENSSPSFENREEKEAESLGRKKLLFTFDPTQSFLFGAPLNELSFAFDPFKPAKSLEQFKLNVSIPIEQIPSYLMPPKVQNEEVVANDALNGLLTCALAKKGASDPLNFTLLAPSLTIQGQPFSNGSIQGHASNGSWIIDHYQLGEWRGAAKLNLANAKEQERSPSLLQWHLKHFDLYFQDELRVQGSSLCHFTPLGLQGSLHLAHFDLIGLNPILKESFKPLFVQPISGYSCGQGNFTLQLPQFQAEVEMELVAKKMTLLDYHIEKSPPFYVSYHSQKGVKIEKLALNFNHGLDGPLPALQVTTDFDYDFLHTQMRSKAQFALKAENLEPLLQKLTSSLDLNPFDFDLSSLDFPGPVAGELLIEMLPHLKWTIALKEGTYGYLGQKLSLKQPTLSVQGQNYRLSGWIVDAPQPLLAQVDLQRELGQKKGRLTLSHENHLPASLKSACYLYFTLSEKQTLHVERIEGQIFGFNLAFAPKKEEPLLLEGGILEGTIRLAQKSALLKERLHFYEELFFQGQIVMHPENWQKSFLKGAFASSRFELLGLELKGLQGELFCTPLEALLSLNIQDVALQLNLEQLKLHHSQDSWQFILEKGEIRQCKPADLTYRGEPLTKKGKYLVIEYARLNHFQGNLFDQNSWKGEGRVVFTNQRPASFSPLALPNGILTRMGLDSDLFTPVIGSLEFAIEKEKVAILHLRDTFSAGKLSQFFLSPSQEVPYVDFAGNLHLSLSIKQQNVLLKLGEMFTIAISGTVDKPIYSLHRGSK